MDLLQTQGRYIVNEAGEHVFLRGVCIGGWLNLEHFINGYPGAEYMIRAALTNTLGTERATHFFDCMRENFLTEADIAFIKAQGASVVRLPLNYRHFESDRKPFHYIEASFALLDQVIEWCTKHELYVILDMHAAQGWQNTDWHSDNANHHALLWKNDHYQERYLALWAEFAKRYAGNKTIAGYDVLNEPLTGVYGKKYSWQPAPDWDALNNLYRRVVNEIRAIDPDHIIFLEGDNFALRFEGLDAPFADNLVYSSHNYMPETTGSQPYSPDTRATIEQRFLEHGGTQFTQQHNVPLWVGEFGAYFNHNDHPITGRLAAMDDLLSILNAHDVHWTTWTFKDVGVMSWVRLDPDSPYMQRIQPYLDKREALHGSYMDVEVTTPMQQHIEILAKFIEATINDPKIKHRNNAFFLAESIEIYTDCLLQNSYVSLFADLAESEIEAMLQSFRLENCQPREDYLEILVKWLRPQKVEA